MSVRGLLKGINDVMVVDEKRSPDLQLTRTLVENQRVPVLFNDVNGGKVVGNLWSDRSRIASALGITKEELLPKMIESISKPVKPKIIDDPLFRQVELNTFDLRKLPIPKFYPKDGGRYITAGVAVSEFEGKKNVSFHRLMLLDDHRFGIRLVPRHLFTMHKLSVEKGKDLPVAFCVGVCPSVLLAAATSADYALDEMEIAASLRNACMGEPVSVAPTDKGLMVPAYSEYVFEGRLTMDRVDEGPFVDITGTYDDVRKQPVFAVDKIYHQKDPILHVVLPGGLEHFMLMGLPREPVMFKTIRQVVPQVHGVRLTEGGCCWLHGVVSITKNKEGDAMNAAMAAFTGHPSMKKVTIVDKDVDIFNDLDVEWAEATRFQASRGLMVVNNAAGSSLDPSADGTTSKIAIDATKPIGVTKGFEKAVLP
jgi:2,5-furandicarboxylate decarboxylase 1